MLTTFLQMALVNIHSSKQAYDKAYYLKYVKMQIFIDENI